MAQARCSLQFLYPSIRSSSAARPPPRIFFGAAAGVDVIANCRADCLRRGGGGAGDRRADGLSFAGSWRRGRGIVGWGSQGRRDGQGSRGGQGAGQGRDAALRRGIDLGRGRLRLGRVSWFRSWERNGGRRSGRGIDRNSGGVGRGGGGGKESPGEAEEEIPGEVKESPGKAQESPGELGEEGGGGIDLGRGRLRLGRVSWFRSWGRDGGRYGRGIDRDRGRWGGVHKELSKEVRTVLGAGNPNSGEGKRAFNVAAVAGTLQPPTHRRHPRRPQAVIKCNILAKCTVRDGFRYLCGAAVKSHMAKRKPPGCHISAMDAGNIGDFRNEGERREPKRRAMPIDELMDVVFEGGSGGRRGMGRDSEAKAGEDDNQQPQGKQPGA